jgi:hypothetical protein
METTEKPEVAPLSTEEAVALTVKASALVLMIAGFDFNAMNAALGIETKAPGGGSTRFGL